MIRQIIFRATILTAIILIIWFLFSQIDFMRVFNIQNRTQTTEQELGKMFWESIEKSEIVIKNDSVNRYVQKIVDRITSNNNIDASKVTLHIIEKSDINAFAMPGGHIVVFSGLITASENESELAGVLGHELAHIKERHVMQKLVKEFGFAVLVSMATGGKGGEAVHQVVRTLSSSAYDRGMEREADLASVDYMIAADINPVPFADFLYKMANDNLPAELYWIATHPESEERAKAVAEYLSDRKFETKPVLTESEWEYLKTHVD